MWQTLGQNEIISFFENALSKQALSHAYLLVGPQHIGKTTMAYDIAMAINCTGDKPPCRECSSCQRTIKHTHSDVITIGLEPSEDKKQAKYEIGIDEIKTLQQLASLPPYESSYKVFIINGVDHLSQEAANCILKTLEEPSPQVVLILLASNQSGVLPTIISRCQIIRFKPISDTFLEKILIEKYEVDRDRAQLLSRLADGCPGYAIEALTDDTVFSRRTNIVEELINLIDSNVDERFNYISKLDSKFRNVEWKNTAELLINTWLSCWHDMILIKNNCVESITNIDFKTALENFSEKLDINDIKDFIKRMNGSLDLISKNANIRLVLEVLMLNMPPVQRSV